MFQGRRGRSHHRRQYFGSRHDTDSSRLRWILKTCNVALGAEVGETEETGGGTFMHADAGYLKSVCQLMGVEQYGTTVASFTLASSSQLAANIVLWVAHAGAVDCTQAVRVAILLALEAAVEQVNAPPIRYGLCGVLTREGHEISPNARRCVIGIDQETGVAKALAHARQRAALRCVARNDKAWSERDAGVGIFRVARDLTALGVTHSLASCAASR